MNELLDSVLRFIWDYFGWWLFFIFVGLCIADSLFGKDYKSLK